MNSRMRLKAYDGTWPHEAHNALVALKINLKYLVHALDKQSLSDLFESDRLKTTSPALQKPVHNPGRRRSIVSGKVMDMDPNVIIGTLTIPYFR
ncbi:hypothetical protein HDV02_000763 [Globomyces sp. JEL0801]|nr:hypothetical protein HDV02_000763 [Globomyces sp. JEL0801]